MAKGLFIGLGEWPMEVELKDGDEKIGTYHPAFIDCYSPEAGLVRFSLDRAFAITDPVAAARIGIAPQSVPEGLTTGEFVVLEGSFSNAEKIVRGEARDRNIKTAKLTVTAVSRQSAYNGSAPTPAPAEALTAA
jgi:hypothetical protein